MFNCVYSTLSSFWRLHIVLLSNRMFLFCTAVGLSFCIQCISEQITFINLLKYCYDKAYLLDYYQDSGWVFLRVMVV